MNPQPRVHFFKDKPREIGVADPKLLAAFRSLIRGQLPWPLYIHGEPGTGKTCAALALCDYLPASIYVTVYDLIDQVLSAYRKGDGFNWRPFGPYRKVDEYNPAVGSSLVVLDEIGTREKVTDTQYDTVKKLLDIREHAPLILISNHPIPKIAEIYDSRIASRCEAGTVVELTGGDRRIT